MVFTGATFIIAAAPAQLPALVYAARFYDPRPKVRTYSHLYLWRVGQQRRGQILTHGAFDDIEPQASPDGKTVYFVRRYANKPPTICAVSLQTKQVRALFSDRAKSDVLDELQVSLSGYSLLVHHSVFSPRIKYPPLYEQWLQLRSLEDKKPYPIQVWRSKSPSNEGVPVESVWAAGEDMVFFFPRNSDTQWYPASRNQIVAVTNHSSPEGEPIKLLLDVDANLARMERDISPSRRYIIGQASWSKANPKGFKFASLVRIDDNDWTLGDFVAAPDETFYWLSDSRLVGIEPDKNGTPTRLHFFAFPKEPPKPNAAGVVSPIQPAQTINLRMANDAKVLAALKEEGEIDFSNLYQVDTIPKRSDGFILGTPWHRSNRGLRFWVDAKTGQVSLWSKCGPPHPSPSGAYFWEQPGSGFAAVGKRKNGAPITEPVLGLNVASYANPTRLMSVVSGAAWTNGADWLPTNKTKEKP